jgi:choline dehydrogenase
VFPYVTNGNIYAPVMMVAEKAADLILGNTPLAAEQVPYYRHRDGSSLWPPGDARNQLTDRPQEVRP